MRRLNQNDAKLDVSCSKQMDQRVKKRYGC